MESDALVNVARDERKKRASRHAHALAFVSFTHICLDTVDATKRVRDDGDREGDGKREKNARDGLQLRHEYAVAGADVDAAAEHVGCELG